MLLAVTGHAGFDGEICLEYGVDCAGVDMRDCSVAVCGVRVSVDERNREYSRDHPGGD